MAIDLSEYNDIVDSLLEKVKDIALVEYTAGRIKDIEYGKYMASAVGSVIENAGTILESYYKAKVLSETVTTEKQIKEQQLANLQKDLLVKSQQIISMTKDDDVKVSQKAMIDQQKLTESEQTSVASSQAYVALNSRTVDISQKSKQLDILGQQLTNMVTELSLKQQTVAKSLEVQDAQIDNWNYNNDVLTNQALLIAQQKLTEVQNTTKATNEAAFISSQSAESTSRKLLIDQQKLTEAQQTAKATYEVNTLLVDEHDIKQSQRLQIDSQKALTDQQKLTEGLMSTAELSLKNSQKILVEQQTATETQNTNVIATKYYVDDNSKETDVSMKLQQLNILIQQFNNLKTEISLKQQTVAKSLNVQDQQISQMKAEEDYTYQKTDVLEKSRLDNKRIQAADKYQQFLSMLSANVVPAATDIANCRILMKDIIDETDTTITATTPTVTANGSSYNAKIS